MTGEPFTYPLGLSEEETSTAGPRILLTDLGRRVTTPD